MEATELKRLERLVSAAMLENKRAALAASTHAYELMGRYVGQGMRGAALSEGWGDRVDPSEYLRDGTGASNFGFDAASTIARPEDRRNGDNYPFWQTEQEHRQIVGQARVLAATSEVALSVVANLQNYCVGTGYTYTFRPKPGYEKDAEAVRLAAMAQRISDEFDESNHWPGDLERELLLRGVRDGEWFVALEHRGGRRVEARVVDTSCVTEPDAKRVIEDYLGMGPGLCWKYGIAAAPGNSAKVYGYFVEWNGDANDWEFYSPDQMVHYRANVDREVKRGLSDMFPVQDNLRRGDKLLGNTLEGAAVQAAIAFIREHAPGTTRDGIASLVSDQADETITRAMPSGKTRTRNIRHYPPGTVHDVTNGLKYHAGPMGGPQGPKFVEVIQAALRMVGVRWSMPEYMISGDASNGNFASTLVAESPFTKATEARQMSHVRACRETKWKAVGVAAKAGVLGASVSQCKHKVECIVDAPEVAVRDRLQEHQIRKEEHEAGILSEHTWAAEAGRDLDDERSKGAARRVQGPTVESIWHGYP